MTKFVSLTGSVDYRSDSAGPGIHGFFGGRPGLLGNPTHLFLDFAVKRNFVRLPTSAAEADEEVVPRPFPVS